MKKIITAILILVSTYGYSQYTPMFARGYQFKYLKADSGFVVPVRDTTNVAGITKLGSMVIRPQDSILYIYTNKWKPVVSDSAGFQALLNLKVDSVRIYTDTLWNYYSGVGVGQVFTVSSLFPSGHTFDITTGIFSTQRNGTTDITVDLDGRYSFLTHSHAGLNPIGGTTGQVLKKNTNSDYDYSWQNEGDGFVTTSQLDDSTAAIRADFPVSVSSQWTTTGSNIYYNTGKVFIGGTSDDGSGLKLQAPSLHIPSQTGLIKVGSYGTISETDGGLAYITGNNMQSDPAVSNQVIKSFTTDAANFIRMRYDNGITFHTGIGSGDAAGTQYADDVNERFKISNSGALKAKSYGAGTFTGTPATYPAFDASGNIIEVSSIAPANFANTNLTATGNRTHSFRNLYSLGIDSLTSLTIQARSGARRNFFYADDATTEMTSTDNVSTHASFYTWVSGSVAEGAFAEYVGSGSNKSTQIRLYENNMTFSSSKYKPVADSFINFIVKGLHTLSTTPAYIAAFDGDTLKKYAYSPSFYDSTLMASVKRLKDTAQAIRADFPSGEPYKVYVAQLSQSGTGAPTATVLENTLGVTPVWSRTTAGNYLATITGGLFVSSKTATFLNGGGLTSGGSSSGFCLTMWSSTNSINLQTYSVGFANTDGILNAPNSVIEIRVYN